MMQSPRWSGLAIQRSMHSLHKAQAALQVGGEATAGVAHLLLLIIAALSLTRGFVVVAYEVSPWRLSRERVSE